MSGTARRATALQVASGVVLVGIIAGPYGARAVRDLARTRGAVAVYARLVASANAQDLPTIRSLCTDRYLAEHPPRPSGRGGVAGFPRQIHPNFRAWVQGDEVWLCQGNRVGLVVRFVPRAGRWRYDGPVGLLRSDGVVDPADRDDRPEERWPDRHRQPGLRS